MCTLDIIIWTILINMELTYVLGDKLSDYYTKYIECVITVFLSSVKHKLFPRFWCKLRVIHYDNRNRGISRLSITENTIDRLNIYFLADHAIIRLLVNCNSWWRHDLPKYILSLSIVPFILCLCDCLFLNKIMYHSLKLIEVSRVK
jgi:hypothetical protein